MSGDDDDDDEDEELREQFEAAAADATKAEAEAASAAEAAAESDGANKQAVAATKIAAAHRGKMARAQVVAIRSANNAELVQQAGAATKIASRHRGKVARARVTNLKAAKHAELEASVVAADQAVELVDTDGDKSEYRWDGKDLVVWCNGGREQSITTITFYKQTSVLEDASGTLELPEDTCDGVVEELRLLCAKVGVAFVLEATGGPVGPLASGTLAARALAAAQPALEVEEVGTKLQETMPQPTLVLPDKTARRALFNKIDNNGNGGLSLAEIDKAVVGGVIGEALGLPDFEHKPALMRAYKAADTSHDGFIERDEFSKLLSYLVYFNNLWHKFEQIDSDHDRRINAEEFTAGCATLGLELSAAEAADEFAVVDSDGGGMILFVEFCSWVAKREAEATEDKPEPELSEGVPTAQRCGRRAERERELASLLDEVLEVDLEADLEEFKAGVDQLEATVQRLTADDDDVVNDGAASISMTLPCVLCAFSVPASARAPRRVLKSCSAVCVPYTTGRWRSWSASLSPRTRQRLRTNQACTALTWTIAQSSTRSSEWQR